ncbi:MAG: DMT family transporter [Ignavibacteria bacterium]|nr:DMT family transporter [Ignavibacteria bacterium]
MRSYLVYAVLAGVAWGVGGYFEKLGLRELSMPPIIGIALRTAVALLVLGLISIPAWKGFAAPAGTTSAWWMIVIGGGIVAGSLGMWSFYTSLSLSENLGVTLAVAFALAPVAGTVIGFFRGDQPADLRTMLGLIAIVGGIVLVQLGRDTAR